MSCRATAAKECHFYLDKSESLMKDLFWIISAIGGVFVPFYFTKDLSIGSAGFLFFFSLLMEFYPKLSHLHTTVGRIFYGSFFLVDIGALIISIIMILGRTTTLSTVLITLCFISSSFFLYDILFALFAPNDVFNTKPVNLPTPNSHQEQIDIFRENALAGNLGSIEGGN